MRKSLNRVRQTFQVLGSAARARRDHRHLRELPDYLLRDIGLNRSDVASPEAPLPTGAERWGSWG